MLTRRACRPRKKASLLAAAGVACVAVSATTITGAAAAVSRLPGPGPGGRAQASASRPRCNAGPEYQTMAHRLARALGAAMRSRFTSTDPAYDPFQSVSLSVSDDSLELTCWYHSTRLNYSASAVKATILAALLLMAQDERRGLGSWEKNEAWLMITQSDNAAATALWDHVGLARLQHFLDRAKMTQTELNTWGAWGLTEITPHDETVLLRLLKSPDRVLTNRSRDYELDLMSHVISAQAWGVRAGGQKYFTWHIKNGWAPLPDPDRSAWVVNSIGCFLHQKFGYTIVVLTRDNPASGLSYGIATIEKIARVINRALVPSAISSWPESAPPAVAGLRPVLRQVLPARPGRG